MLYVMPKSGKYNISKIDKYGLWFIFGNSEICIPLGEIEIDEETRAAFEKKGAKKNNIALTQSNKGAVK